MNFGECDELRSSFSPAVSRNIMRCCVSNIGETPKKRQFLRRGVNPYSQKVYKIFSTPLLRNCRSFGLSPIFPYGNTGEKVK